MGTGNNTSSHILLTSNKDVKKNALAHLHRHTRAESN